MAGRSNPTSAQRQPSKAEEPHAPWLPWAQAGILIGGVLLTLAAWFKGDPVAALAAAVLTLSIAQGLWRGLSGSAGLLVGTLVALILARPVGRAIEPLASSLFSVSGLMGRLVATLVAGALILIITSILVTWPIRRAIKARPTWRAWDRLIGGGAGALEGFLLVLVLLWAPKALEPFARARLADRQAEIDQGLPTSAATLAADRQAQRIRTWAEAIDRSSLSGVVQATNPIADSSWMKLAEDFSSISRHPQARDHFLQSDALKQLENLPSVKSAIDELKGDPELAGLYSEHGISKDAIWKFLNSPRITSILDRSTITQDIEPLVPALRQAIEEARAKVPQPR